MQPRSSPTTQPLRLAALASPSSHAGALPYSGAGEAGEALVTPSALPMEPSALARLTEGFRGIRGIQKSSLALTLTGLTAIHEVAMLVYPSRATGLSVPTVATHSTRTKMVEALHATAKHLADTVQFALDGAPSALLPEDRSLLLQLITECRTTFEFLKKAIDEISLGKRYQSRGEYSPSIAFYGAAAALQNFTLANSSRLIQILRPQKLSAEPSIKAEEIEPALQSAAGTALEGAVRSTGCKKVGLMSPETLARIVTVGTYETEDPRFIQSMPVSGAYVVTTGGLCSLDDLLTAANVPLAQYRTPVQLASLAEHGSRITGATGQTDIVYRLAKSGSQVIPIGLHYEPVALSATQASGDTQRCSATRCRLTGRLFVEVPRGTVELHIRVQRTPNALRHYRSALIEANDLLTLGRKLPQENPEAIANAIADDEASRGKVYTNDPNLEELFGVREKFRFAALEGFPGGNCQTLSAVVAKRISDAGVGALLVGGYIINTDATTIESQPGHMQVVTIGGLIDPTTAIDERCWVDPKALSPFMMARTEEELRRAPGAEDVREIFNRLGELIITEKPTGNERGKKDEPERGHTFVEERDSNAAQRVDVSADCKRILMQTVAGSDFVNGIDTSKDVIAECVRQLRSGAPYSRGSITSIAENLRSTIDYLKGHLNTRGEHGLPDAARAYIASQHIIRDLRELLEEAQHRQQLSGAEAGWVINALIEPITHRDSVAWAFLPDELIPILLDAQPTMGSQPYERADDLTDPEGLSPHEIPNFLRLFETVFRHNFDVARHDRATTESLIRSIVNAKLAFYEQPNLDSTLFKGAQRQLNALLAYGIAGCRGLSFPDFIVSNPQLGQWFANDGGGLRWYEEVAQAGASSEKLARWLTPDGHLTKEFRAAVAERLAHELHHLKRDNLFDEDNSYDKLVQSLSLDLSPHRDSITRSYLAQALAFVQQTSDSSSAEISPYNVIYDPESPFLAWALPLYLYVDARTLLSVGKVLYEAGGLDCVLLRASGVFPPEKQAVQQVCCRARVGENAELKVTFNKGRPDDRMRLEADLPIFIHDWISRGLLPRSSPVTRAFTALSELNPSHIAALDKAHAWRQQYPAEWQTLSDRIFAAKPDSLKPLIKLIEAAIPEFERKKSLVRLRLCELAAMEALSTYGPTNQNRIEIIPKQLSRGLAALPVREIADQIALSIAGVSNLELGCIVAYHFYFSPFQFNTPAQKFPLSSTSADLSVTTNPAEQFRRWLISFESTTGINLHTVDENARAYIQSLQNIERHQQTLASPGLRKKIESDAATTATRSGWTERAESVRRYEPGDDPRHINWGASGRRDHLLVHESQAPQSSRGETIEFHVDLLRLGLQREHAGVQGSVQRLVAALWTYRHEAPHLYCYLFGLRVPILGHPYKAGATSPIRPFVTHTTEELYRALTVIGINLALKVVNDTPTKLSPVFSIFDRQKSQLAAEVAQSYQATSAPRRVFLFVPPESQAASARDAQEIFRAQFGCTLHML